MKEIYNNNKLSRDPTHASAIGKKTKKHFATEFIKAIQSNKAINNLYANAFKMQNQILNNCIKENRQMKHDEARQFDVLSKLTNKALDKVVPNLQQTDLNINSLKQITVVDLTQQKTELLQNTPFEEVENEQ